MVTDRKIEAESNLEYTYTVLPRDYFVIQVPDRVPKPGLVVLNETLAEELGLDSAFLYSKEGIDWLSGRVIGKGSMPIAQAYAGCQFGHFTMLGDGRAVLLGERITPEGKRVDIQLKGSGATPFARGGDGKAALGPMLREYIISEGLHGLGIPTTRSLAVLTTGERVWRQEEQPGAILVRVSHSHIRVGTFEYGGHLADRSRLKALADYALWRHFPEGLDRDQPYRYLLRCVVERQASLIAKWQAVGFIHGVMNTDNMAISGESLDFGPCAFMDRYDPGTVFSSIDTEGRYAYQNQPAMAAWNLSRMGEALLPLLSEKREEAVHIAGQETARFSQLYYRNWLKEMGAKIGLFHPVGSDGVLIKDLLQLLYQHHEDYTNLFRDLTRGEMPLSSLGDSVEFQQWRIRWKQRLDSQEESYDQVADLLRRTNPRVIPRNERVEEAIADAVEEGDLCAFGKLVKVLQDPYDYEKRDDYYENTSGRLDHGYQTFCGT